MLTIPVQFDISPTDGALIIKVHDYVVPDVRFSIGNIAPDRLEEMLRAGHDNKGGQYAT
ncbi:hypothetical protein GCM10017044_22970 [Kordiimonas sediminis]|uniref:Uncharacterized protein n=2 Tax=Kordiimonas sediminis TaxID=1735581 RepID=A0A919AVW3_9PROT|nr:hypothetical protein GCM10017044_22970 [Kordiimonas sediminis]